MKTSAIHRPPGWVERATRVLASATRRGARRWTSATVKTNRIEQRIRRVAESGTRVACSTRILGVALLCLPSAAHACSACMGDVNSKSAGAINAAIFLMIGVIGSMLAALGVFAFYLSRRAAAPLPPHAEIDESINDPEDFS